jgi:hypothetical protein
LFSFTALGAYIEKKKKEEKVERKFLRKEFK